jgi:cytochrome c oxidase assembly factor CtaG
MSLEAWTMMRFLMYPVMLVCGIGLAVMFWQSYQRRRCAEQAWAFWLALAGAVQGAAGMVALVISQDTGFSNRTSAVFTIGTMAMTVVLVSALLALGQAAWRRRETD